MLETVRRVEPYENTYGISLYLECEEEELSPAQIAANERQQREHDEACLKIEQLKAEAEAAEKKAREDAEIAEREAAEAAVRAAEEALKHAEEQARLEEEQRRIAEEMMSQQPDSPMIDDGLDDDDDGVMMISGAGGASQPNSGGPRSAYESSFADFLANPSKVSTTKSGGTTVVTAPAGFKLVVNPKTGSIMGTVADAKQAGLMPSKQQPVVEDSRMKAAKRLYGQPKKSAGKTKVLQLFQAGQTVESIYKQCNTQSHIALAYLTDMLFLGENVDYVRLSSLLGVSEEMTNNVGSILDTKPDITFVQLKDELPQWTFHQLRMCVARLALNLQFSWHEKVQVENFTTHSMEQPQTVVSSFASGMEITQTFVNPDLDILVQHKNRAPYGVCMTKETELKSLVLSLLENNGEKLKDWMVWKRLFCQTCPQCAGTRTHQRMLQVNADGTKKLCHFWKCTVCHMMYGVEHGSFYWTPNIKVNDMMSLIFHWSLQTNQSQVQATLPHVSVENIRFAYQKIRRICGQRIWEAFHSRALSVGSKTVSFVVDVRSSAIADILCVYDVGCGRAAMRCFPAPIDLQVLFDFILENIPTKSSVHIASKFPIDLMYTSSAYQDVAEHYAIDVSDDPKRVLETHSRKFDGYFEDFVRPILDNLGAMSDGQQTQLETLQGLLDELAWLECYSYTPLDAFFNILEHIREAFETKAKQSAKPQQDQQLAAIVNPLSLKSKLESKIGSAAKRPESPTPQPTKKGSAILMIAEKDSENAVVLQHLFYSTLPGQGAQGKENKSVAEIYKFKCHVCKTSIDNNIRLMQHIHNHIEVSRQKNLDTNDMTRCKVCYNDFDTPYAMHCHLDEMHSDSIKHICRICTDKFGDSVKLVKHMQDKHVACEMPYKCQVCNYRSSFYRDVVEHFETTHSGTNKLLCLYCLKVHTLSRDPTNQTVQFHQHVSKHQSRVCSKRCKSCVLSFFTQPEVNVHAQAEHLSFFKQKDVMQHCLEDITKAIYISVGSAPGGKFVSVSMAALPAGTGGKRGKRKLVGNAADFSTTVLNSVDNMNCLECTKPMGADHYGLLQQCAVCWFVSACGASFDKHSKLLHTVEDGGTKNVSKRLKRKARVICRIPRGLLFCACGKSWSNGDQLAKHLGSCRFQSAFSTMDAAISAKEAANAAASARGRGRPPKRKFGDNIKQEPEDPDSGSDVMTTVNLKIIKQELMEGAVVRPPKPPAEPKVHSPNKLARLVLGDLLHEVANAMDGVSNYKVKVEDVSSDEEDVSEEESLSRNRDSIPPNEDSMYQISSIGGSNEDEPGSPLIENLVEDNSNGSVNKPSEQERMEITTDKPAEEPVEKDSAEPMDVDRTEKGEGDSAAVGDKVGDHVKMEAVAERAPTDVPPENAVSISAPDQGSGEIEKTAEIVSESAEPREEAPKTAESQEEKSQQAEKMVLETAESQEEGLTNAKNKDGGETTSVATPEAGEVENPVFANPEKEKEIELLHASSNDVITSLEEGAKPDPTLVEATEASLAVQSNEGPPTLETTESSPTVESIESLLAGESVEAPLTAESTEALPTVEPVETACAIESVEAHPIIESNEGPTGGVDDEAPASAGLSEMTVAPAGGNETEAAPAVSADATAAPAGVSEAEGSESSAEMVGEKSDQLDNVSDVSDTSLGSPAP